MARTRQRWKTPNNGWNERTKTGGFGVVIRDHNAIFLAATSGNLENVYLPLHAELLVARQAAIFVQELPDSNGAILL